MPLRLVGNTSISLVMSRKATTYALSPFLVRMLRFHRLGHGWLRGAVVPVLVDFTLISLLRSRTATTYALSPFLVTMLRFHWLGRAWLRRVHSGGSSCRHYLDLTGHVTGYGICIVPIIGKNSPISRVTSRMLTTSPLYRFFSALL